MITGPTKCDVEIVFNAETCFLYVDHRNEPSKRHVIPRRLLYGSTEYYPESQWLLECWDLDRNDYRTFALKNICVPG